MKNTLLVARVGPTRDGIQALLDSMKDMELVTVTDDIGAALAYASENCPNLIVLVIDRLTHELKEALPALRNRCLETGMLVLASSNAARQDFINYQIDVVLPIGIQAGELAQVIEELLKTEDHPTSTEDETETNDEFDPVQKQ